MARTASLRRGRADGLCRPLAASARLLAGAAVALAGPVLLSAARGFCHQPRPRGPGRGAGAVLGGPPPALAATLRRPPVGLVEGAVRAPLAQRHTALAALPSPGPFLTFEELKPQKPRKKGTRRRGKIWVFEDGVWRRLHPDAPPEKTGRETVASDDPVVLAKQIGDSRVARQLIAFLENAIPSPAFGAEHALLTLHRLWIQRSTCNATIRETLKDKQVLHELAARGRGLFLAEEAQQVPVGLVALALRSLAVYKEDLPQLHPLMEPLLAMATKRLTELKPRHVAYLVWAVAELRDVDPDLQDRLLPLLVDRKRLKKSRKELGKLGRGEDHYMLEKGLLKLRKEVPFLRQVLPE